MELHDLFDRPPWPHQLDAVALGIDAIEHKEHACITSPTGSGKSLVLVAIMRHCAKNYIPCILYTNRILLTDQTIRVMDEAGLHYGVISATDRERRATLRDVQIARIQTVQRRVLKDKREELFPARVVLVDEAHCLSSGVNLDVINAHKAQGAVILGMTATPMGVSHIYRRLIVAGNVSICRHVGALVWADYKAPSELDCSRLKLQPNGEFSAADIKQVWNKHLVGYVYDAWREHNPEARPALGFAPGVAQSKWFVDEFRKRGVRAAHVDGEDVYLDGQHYAKDRAIYQDVIDQWKAGEIKLLWNRFVLREGIDLPEMYHLILACPIGSLHSFIQVCGRVLRYHPTTPGVLIHDHAGNYHRHKFSPNDDIPWEEFYALDPTLPTREHKHDLSEHPEKEPLVCPKCGTVIYRGRDCHKCGARIGKRLRKVIQKDGTIRTVSKPAVAPRIVREKPNTYELWERTFYRCRKAGMTLSQAEGLFFYEQRYYPPSDLPLMPKRKYDRFRRIDKIHPGDLLDQQGHRDKRAAEGRDPCV